MSELMMKKAVFLDRDGVINKWTPGYTLGWDQFEFLPGVMDAMFELYCMDYEIFVISNQSGISKGLEYKGRRVTRESIFQIFSKMDDEITALVRSKILRNYGIAGFPQVVLPELACVASILDPRIARVIRAFEFCPHLPEHNCACRKPKPGMIYSLAVKWGIDLSKSWMIGDQDSDILAGYNADIRKLIKIGDEELNVVKDNIHLNWICLASISQAPDLLSAVKFIQGVDKEEEAHGY